MSGDKKQKGNWFLLLVGVVLGSVITVGAFWISPSNFNKAQNSVVNIVKNFDWGWTGFGETKVITTNTKKDDKTTISEQAHSGKTLWDWLELSSRLLVPILIFGFGYQFKKRDEERAKEQERLEKERAKEQERLEKERAKEQERLERGIAKDNLSEEAIQAYLDNLAKLLLDKELRKELFPNVNDILNPSDCDNPVRDVARTQTITILRRLEGDTDRQARILNFLRDAELYEFIFKNTDLSKIDLSRTHLEEAHLEKADLEKADLEEAHLEEAHLEKADLREAHLKKAHLKKAYLREAHLEEADLEEADLEKARLREAHLEKAHLEKAYLREAYLREAYLREAHLEGADLSRANLKRACFVDALRYNHKQIKSACNWAQAIYKGKWNEEKKTWEAMEPDNTNFIKELKGDTASDPEDKPDCSIWEE